MENKPVSNRLYSFIILYDMHTSFFNRALVNISDEDAHNRLDTKANHIAWIAGSILHERYQLAALLGIKEQHQGEELFKDHKGIQDGASYPSLDSYKKDWENISAKLREALLKVDDKTIDNKFEMMPGYQMTLFEYISFQIYREATCIGQIALWRRLLGYEALKYDE